MVLRGTGEISLSSWHAPRTVSPAEKHFQLLIFQVCVLRACAWKLEAFETGLIVCL